MKFTKNTLALGVVSALLSFAASAADNIKIAVIDPLSGPFANVGEAMVRHAQLSADAINAKGGVLGGAKFEIIALDSKSNPQEAQLAAKQAIDQGVRYINQTNGSNVAAALNAARSRCLARLALPIISCVNLSCCVSFSASSSRRFWHAAQARFISVLR